jgi:hypothetical protein
MKLLYSHQGLVVSFETQTYLSSSFPVASSFREGFLKAIPKKQTIHPWNGTLRPVGQIVHQIGLGWMVMKKYGSEIVEHNGYGGGCHSFCGLDKSQNFGVVVLSNSNYVVEDIGLHLLNSNYELKEYKQRTKRVPINSEF